MKPTLKAPGTKRLKLKCDKLLSNFVFNFNLRRHRTGGGAGPIGEAATRLAGGGLHSSSFQLNLGRF